MSKRRVAYYYDPDTGSYTYGVGHLMKPHRVRVTHELITSYDMLGKMQVLRPKRATPQDMTAFHTDEYIHFLNRVTPETVEELTGHGTRFLVGEDNPVFEGVFEFCSISAGGSISASERIASGSADIAINWAGGLHHAKKREASGFCYINDIVLSILELLRTYPRVLYVDIDCHHGDGVEEAFYTTDRVMTCSFHKFGEYFPGTGAQEDKGRGKGKGYSVNVPLKDGITDEAFKGVFDPIISKILEVYRPSVVVLQCGADSLSGDRLGCFNLTMQGHAHCVQFIRDQNVPLILLGGGGYTVKNVVRAWTYETACTLGLEKDIDPNLPWNEYFEWFGPRYRLEVVENNMEDLNVRDGMLDKIRTTALQQLQELAHAPSVGMHDVPRTSVGQHLGLRSEQVKKLDDLDSKLAAEHTRCIHAYNINMLQQHQYHYQDPQDSDDTPPSEDDKTSDDDDGDDDDGIEQPWDLNGLNEDEDNNNGDEDAISHTSHRSTQHHHNQHQHHQHHSHRHRRRPRPPKKRMSILSGQYYDPSSVAAAANQGGYAAAAAAAAAAAYAGGYGYGWYGYGHGYGNGYGGEYDGSSGNVNMNMGMGVGLGAAGMGMGMGMGMGLSMMGMNMNGIMFPTRTPKRRFFVHQQQQQNGFVDEETEGVAAKRYRAAAAAATMTRSNSRQSHVGGGGSRRRRNFAATVHDGDAEDGNGWEDDYDDDDDDDDIPPDSR